MATSPATAPEMAPNTLGFPLRIHSASIQPSTAAAVAKCVATNALVASRRGSHRASGVEAEPADPQQAGADDADHHAVRLHRFNAVAFALAQVQCADQRRDARADVHHRSAGEVEGRDFAAEERVQQAAFAPHHVRQREVDDENPQHREQQHRAELHALGERARNQRGRDDREHELVDHVGLLRDGAGVVGIGRAADAVQKQVAEIAEEGRAFAEREAVADDGPQHADDGHQDEAVHHGAEDVLAADQAAVEKRQARAGHHQAPARRW